MVNDNHPSTPITLSGPEVGTLSGEAPEHLIIFLHGLGADGNDLIGLAEQIQPLFPNAHFMSPHAPFPCDLAPFGRQWFSLYDRSEEAIIEGIKKSAPILNEFIDSQLEYFGLTDDKVALIGFSQGTMMALYAGLRRPYSLGGILGYSGALVDPDSLTVEIESRPDICLIHGTADEVVAFDNMEIAEAALKAAGVTVETHACPGLGHGIDGTGLQIGVQFLEERLQEEEE